MRHLWLFAFMIVFLGCSEIEPGSCYPNPAGGAGGAGSMPIGAGVGASASGDFATEPPKKPQDATNPPPGCYSVPQSPCNEKCLADYEAAAGECGKIENEAQRRTCQDGAYARYKTCRGICQQNAADCLEECKKQCDQENERCIKNCPKGDKNCMDGCNQAYGRCLKECDKRCK